MSFASHKQQQQGLTTQKLSKLDSDSNRKLEKLESVFRAQKELKVRDDEEGRGLLEEEQQQLVQDVDFQILRDNTKERKERLFNAHRSLSTVKNIFTQISELATQQVESIYVIDQNYENTEKKTKEASKELLKSQGQQRSKVNQKLAIIMGLIICILGLLVLISQKTK